MKLKEYLLPGWNGKNIEKEIAINNIIIKLLGINLSIDPPEEGRRNLVAVDEYDNIIWIANLPSEQKIYGFYGQIVYENGILKAWCGSFYCEIDPNDGKILAEEFVK